MYFVSKAADTANVVLPCFAKSLVEDIQACTKFETELLLHMSLARNIMQEHSAHSTCHVV